MGRSIFSRIVWLSTALSALLVAGLWFLTDTVIGATQADSAQEAVDRDLAGLVDIYATSGVSELQQRINDRLALTPQGRAAPIYLLIDDDAGHLAGNISAWPAGVSATTSQSAEIELDIRNMVFVRATRLGPGLRILVGQRMDEAHGLRGRVRNAFLLGGLIFVIIVAIAGRFSTIHLRRRIAAINLDLRENADGQAVVSNAPRDEIDQLAADSATVIARVQGLLAAHRDTTDRLAHEIRTPLMHLDTRLARALELSPGTDIAGRLVDARSDIRRLIGILETLLDIAWNKAGGEYGSDAVQFDLTAMVLRVCDLYFESAEDAGLNLVHDIAPDVSIVADEAHFVRVLTNLLDNAMKYVPRGGSVRVTLEQGPRLIVEDDGPGVPEAERELIFERFQRGSGANSAEAKPGAGLGLALARAIVERYGFGLICEAGEKGARFVIARRDRQ